MKRRVLKTLILCLVLSLVLGPNVLAIDADNNGSVKVLYMIEDHVVPNVSFQLYKLASVGDTGEFLWESWVGDHALSEAVSDASTVQKAVETSGTDYTVEQDTDANGLAVFPNIEPGIYLITGDAYTVDDIIYHAVPAAVQIPVVYEGQVLYDATVEIKHTFNREDEPSVAPPTTEPPVSKPDKRPIPDVEGVSVKVHNPLPEWEPLKSYTPPRVEFIEDLSEVDSGSSIIDDNDVPLANITPEGDKLPQTGLLNWPIPILTACGLVFGVVGAVFVIDDFVRKRQC